MSRKAVGVGKLILMEVESGQIIYNNSEPLQAEQLSLEIILTELGSSTQ